MTEIERLSVWNTTGPKRPFLAVRADAYDALEADRDHLRADLAEAERGAEFLRGELAKARCLADEIAARGAAGGDVEPPPTPASASGKPADTPDAPSPPEPAPDVDAIIERLRGEAFFVGVSADRPMEVQFSPVDGPGGGFLTLDAAVAAVREAAAPSPPEPDERLETYHVDTFRAEPIAEQGVDGA